MRFPTRCFLTAIVGTCHLTAILPAVAAPILGLFSTGLSPTGTLIESGAVDSHYTLTASADEIAVGPETYSLTPDFVVVNGGTAANPTGLRVDDLVLTGVSVQPALNIVRNEAEVRVSWPTAAGNWILEETVELPAGWNGSTATVAVEGTENVARIPPSGTARYYRLRQ